MTDEENKAQAQPKPQPRRERPAPKVGYKTVVIGRGGKKSVK